MDKWNDMLVFDLLHPSDLARLKPYLDPVWVGRRIGEDIFDDSFRELPGALVLLKNDCHFEAGFYVRAFCAVHFIPFVSYLTTGA